MSTISVRLPNKLLHELDHHAQAAHLARAAYIRQAIELMNKERIRKERAQKINRASLKVRKESMNINKEFSRFEHDPED